MFWKVPAADGLFVNTNLRILGHVTEDGHSNECLCVRCCAFVGGVRLSGRCWGRILLYAGPEARCHRRAGIFLFPRHEYTPLSIR